MPDPTQRELLATRATAIYNAGGVTYSQAISQAMAEFNPDNSPELVELLMRSLLNVPDEPPVLMRHRIVDEPAEQ